MGLGDTAVRLHHALHLLRAPVGRRDAGPAGGAPLRLDAGPVGVVAAPLPSAAVLRRRQRRLNSLPLAVRALRRRRRRRDVESPVHNGRRSECPVNTRLLPSNWRTFISIITALFAVCEWLLFYFSKAITAHQVFFSFVFIFTARQIGSKRSNSFFVLPYFFFVV